MKSCFTLILLAIFLNCFSQSRSVDIIKADSIVYGKAVLDFAIPDIPAFKALGIDPSNILRPSSPKQFALSFSNFAENLFSTIPKNLAVEVAPALITNKWYTLSEYREKPGIRLLTKTRVSIGSNENTLTRSSNLALGLRTTFLDKGDYRNDTAYLIDSVYNKLRNLHNYIDTRLESVMIAYGGPIKWTALPELRRQQIIDSIGGDARQQLGDVNAIINKSIENYKKLNWNASRIDFAYSLLLSSSDSLIKNITLNKHLLWATFAIKPGKNNHWGQILIGFNNITFKEADSWKDQFSGNLRFYAGANKLKGLFELQYKSQDLEFKNNKPSLFYQLGVEASPFKGFWIQFSTGVLNGLQKDNFSSLRNNLNLSITFPEDLNFF